MKLLRLAPENTKFPFMRFRRVSYPLSATLSIIAVLLFVFVHMNFGIDFAGGTVIELRAKGGSAEVGTLRTLAEKLNLGEIEVQAFGNKSDATMRFGLQPGGDVAQQAAVERVRAAVENDYELRRVEVVGPRVSNELVQSGTLGVVLSIIAVLGYLWFRFEWQFAVSAVIATMHDLLLTVGFLRADAARIQHHVDRRHSHHRRLFAERDGRRARPYSRDDAQIQKNEHGAHHRHVDQRRAAAHHHDRDDGVSRAAVAGHFRRPGDPLVFAGDDLGHRRRHLFVGVHLFADADLSWSAHRRC